MLTALTPPPPTRKNVGGRRPTKSNGVCVVFIFFSVELGYPNAPHPVIKLLDWLLINVFSLYRSHLKKKSGVELDESAIN